MFALITPRAYSTRNKNADKAAAVLPPGRHAVVPLKAERSSSSGQVTLLGCRREGPFNGEVSRGLVFKH